MEPMLLTIKNTATTLSVSTRTVHRLIEAGDLETVSVRSARRVLASSVGDYLNRSTTAEVTK